MQYIDQSGLSVRLTNKIGVGGEGAVFGVAGDADLVAKIYHTTVEGNKAAKLTAMAQLATPDIRRIAAWPRATLHRQHGGPVVGILLPRIKNCREIHELYSPAHRKVNFPQADWRFLIRVAHNCAVAFSTLHKHNIVIGDVNQGNVFVGPDALVSLIDCDSFQMQANGQLHKCRVGVSHYIPPELQKANLAEVVRTPNHDNFGLAILIFHLLFMGRHPFVGRYSGPGEMPPIEVAIREYRFAYGALAASFQVAPPPHSLSLSSLPKTVSILFERAFGKGSEVANARPTAATWAQALKQLEACLCKCADDPGHVYAQGVKTCPWCAIAKSGGQNFFISVSIQAVVTRGASFSLAGVWAQIQAVSAPDRAFTPAPRSPVNQIRPSPLPKGVYNGRGFRKTLAIIASLATAMTLFACIVPNLGLFSIPVALVFGAWWIAAIADSPVRRVKQQRRKRLRAKMRDLEDAKFNQRCVAHRYLQQFQAKFDLLRQTKATYEQLQTRRDDEIRTLQQQVRQRQMDDYLRRCFISSASIGGIGPMRIVALESEGIETAYDITKQRVLSVPGFGEKLTEKLLNWRRQKELEFRFDPTKGVPRSDIQTLEMKYAQAKFQCEQVLKQGPDELRRITAAAKAEVECLDRQVAELEHTVAQAHADLAIVAKIPWWY